MKVSDQLSRADEIEVFAGQLLDYARGLRQKSAGRGGTGLFWPESSASVIDTVEAIRNVRQIRAKYLDRHLLGEPVWDMLLDLFKARLCGADVPVATLCQTIGEFEATSRRWIHVLVEAGLVEHVAPGAENRVPSVRLTEMGAMQMSDVVLDAQIMLFRAKVAHYTGAQKSG